MNQLIVFIKNPVKGKIKTRLAATIGDDRALDVYLQLLKHTLSVSEKSHAEINLFFSDFLTGEYPAAKTFLQQGEDLGERMKNAFKLIFETKKEKVIIIGTDCAELTETTINDAFEKLNETDFVIGPANDGGYYLLGMKAFFPEIFSGISWSTSDVFEKTREIIQKSNKTLSVLKTLRDVDTEEDLFTLKKISE